MKVEILPFGELNTLQVYKILDIRNKVFVVEQNCVYLDTDFKDLEGIHLMIWDGNDNLVAYCRILPPGTVYEDESSIGRVVTVNEVRGSGLGKKLMDIAIANTKKLYPDIPIRIEAQSYLIPFYSSFGFEIIGQDYLLDGIPHREMVLV